MASCARRANVIDLIANARKMNDCPQNQRERWWMEEIEIGALLYIMTRVNNDRRLVFRPHPNDKKLFHFHKDWKYVPEDIITAVHRDVLAYTLTEFWYYPSQSLFELSALVLSEKVENRYVIESFLAANPPFSNLAKILSTFQKALVSWWENFIQGKIIGLREKKSYINDYMLPWFDAPEEFRCFEDLAWLETIRELNYDVEINPEEEKKCHAALRGISQKYVNIEYFEKVVSDESDRRMAKEDFSSVSMNSFTLSKGASSLSKGSFADFFSKKNLTNPKADPLSSGHSYLLGAGLGERPSFSSSASDDSSGQRIGREIGVGALGEPSSLSISQSDDSFRNSGNVKQEEKLPAGAKLQQEILPALRPTTVISAPTPSSNTKKGTKRRKRNVNIEWANIKPFPFVSM